MTGAELVLKNIVNHRKYYENADVIRGFAILLVALGHAVAKENVLTTENAICNTLYNYIYSFHMPLFFIVSGFVFGVKDNFRRHVWNVFRTLFVPYVFFNLFTISLQQLLPFFSIEERTVGEQIKAMLLSGGNLWFIYVLIEFRLLFYLIDKIIDSKIARAGIILILLLAMAMINMPETKYFLFNLFKLYAPFFMIGYMLRLVMEQKEVKLSMPKKVGAGIISLLLWIVFFYTKGSLKEWIPSGYIIYFLTAITGSAACYFLISSISQTKVRKILVGFGKTSFQIYIFNGYFISVSRTLLSTLFRVDSAILLTIANFVVGLIPNYYFSSLILKLKVVRAIFGKKN